MYLRSFNYTKYNFSGYRSSLKHCIIVDYSKFIFSNEEHDEGSKIDSEGEHEGVKKELNNEAISEENGKKEVDKDLKIKNVIGLVKFLKKYFAKAGTIRDNAREGAIEFGFKVAQLRDEINIKNILCCGQTLKIFKAYSLDDYFYFLSFSDLPDTVAGSELEAKLVKQASGFGSIVFCRHLQLHDTSFYSDRAIIMLASKTYYNKSKGYNSKMLSFYLEGKSINFEFERFGIY